MNTKDTDVALAKAFCEVTLSLIDLLDVYEADPDLVEALGRIYRAHLKNSVPMERPPNPRAALHGLAKEMETAADEIA